MMVEENADTEAKLMRLRWPNGVACPGCGSTLVLRRPRRAVCGWRCRRCRRDFSVTSGTALHASKLGLADWEAAAHAPDDSTAGVSALLGVSAVTARRISRILRSAGAPPGERRLANLLAARPPAQQSSALLGDPDPLAASPETHRRILAALRVRLGGASAALTARDADISVSHARRCLRQLESEDFVQCRHARIPWGYRHRTVRLWELKLTDTTMDALTRLPWRPASSECPDRIPPEHWRLFWSGASAADLRLPDDALQVADTMIGGPDPRARDWALSCLPVDALRELRTMRGYASGETTDLLDAAIEGRSRA